VQLGSSWKSCQQIKKTFDLVSVNPHSVIGPELSKPKADQLNLSNLIIWRLLAGKIPAIIKLSWTFVDVVNVAEAHVLAMENKDAKGRYLVAAQTIWLRDITVKLKEKYPKFKAPFFSLDGSFGQKIVGLFTFTEDKGTRQYLDSNLGRFLLFNNEKAKSIGVEFRPVYDSIFELADWFYANNYVK